MRLKARIQKVEARLQGTDQRQPLYQGLGCAAALIGAGVFLWLAALALNALFP